MDIRQRTSGPQLAHVIDAADHGMLWLDREGCVAGHNPAYRRLLDIGDPTAFVGQSYRSLLQHLLDRGEFLGGQNELQSEERLCTARRDDAVQTERIRPNGVALSIKAAPVYAGGYVLTYFDITHERSARERQRRNAKATVVAMANFAEHRDTDTGVHVLRVARLVGQTARKLMMRGTAPEIDEEYIEQVATASILHDVGKISTPDRILLKSGGLTLQEREIIKKHTGDGARLLKQAKLTMGESQYLALGIDIALTHHEWYDGGGYPHGLAGDAIPLAGRICAVADVFDALTSRRPYKTPWTTDKAIDLIRQQRGTQFDPEVVDAFLDVI
jgi:HD-GYP domain-containing protein (c-di-GMP phosphodiesterase class II)